MTGKDIQQAPEVTYPINIEVDTDTIKSLSKLYNTRTCAPDGWHPKHYGLLGDETLQTLSLIIMLMIFTGQAPSDTQQLQVLMQRKHKGVGRIPPGFYNAIARLVGKVLGEGVSSPWPEADPPVTQYGDNR